jgi:hypothetical protein
MDNWQIGETKVALSYQFAKTSLRLLVDCMKPFVDGLLLLL